MIRLERSRILGHRGGQPHSCRCLGVKIGADLAAIEWLAPYIFILERDETGPPIYGHAGCAIQDVIGSNPRGKVFYDYWKTGARGALESYFDISAKNHLAFRLISIGPRSKTLAVEFETTLIPVTTADTRKSQFVGISLVHGGRPAKTEPDNQLQHLQNVAFVHDGPIGRRCAPRLVHSSHT
jgi:hypothetical protein